MLCKSELTWTPAPIQLNSKTEEVFNTTKEVFRRSPKSGLSYTDSVLREALSSYVYKNFWTLLEKSARNSGRNSARRFGQSKSHVKFLKKIPGRNPAGILWKFRVENFRLRKSKNIFRAANSGSKFRVKIPCIGIPCKKIFSVRQIPVGNVPCDKFRSEIFRVKNFRVRKFRVQKYTPCGEFRS